jgi:hypothetical protein
MPDKPPCDCPWCTRDRVWDGIVASRDTEALLKLIVELRNELCETAECLAYREAIMNGSWPTALEQLEEALKRAKEKR